jgi:hypothetical protein
MSVCFRIGMNKSWFHLQLAWQCVSKERGRRTEEEMVRWIVEINKYSDACLLQALAANKQRNSQEKNLGMLIFVHLVMKFPALVSAVSHMNLLHNLHPVHPRSILILSSNLRPSLPRGNFHQKFPTEVYRFLISFNLPHALPSSSPWCYHGSAWLVQGNCH